MLFVLLGALTFSSLAFSADFQPNDEVKLTRDTPLLFLDKPTRQGMAGETFQVLAYQPEQKKVFLAAKDPAGKQIAVSVAEDLVSLVPGDKAKVQADVLAAVSHQKYAVAKNLLDQALRTSPDDVDLHSLGHRLGGGHPPRHVARRSDSQPEDRGGRSAAPASQRGCD